MALDPKDIFLRNKVAAASYVAVVVAFALWLVLVVFGVSTQAGRDANTIKGLASKLKAAADRAQKTKSGLENGTPVDNPLYCRGFKDEFSRQKQVMQEQNDGVIALFKDRQAKLEHWFSKYGDQYDSKKMPPAGTFNIDFHDEVKRLVIDAHQNFVYDKPGDAAKVLQVWGPEKPVSEAAGGDTPLDVMKKFNVQKAAIDDVDKFSTDAKNPNHLLEPVRFDAPMTGGTDRNGPAPKYTTIPIHLCFSASMRDVPKIVRQVLADEQILFRVKTLKTELLGFTVVHEKADGFFQRWTVNDKGDPIYEKPIYDTAVTAPEQFTPQKEESILPEPKVRVTLDLEAYDFKLDQIVPADASAPAPAAPGQPGQNPPPAPQPAPGGK